MERVEIQLRSERGGLLFFSYSIYGNDLFRKVRKALADDRTIWKISLDWKGKDVRLVWEGESLDNSWNRSERGRWANRPLVCLTIPPYTTDDEVPLDPELKKLLFE
jgi:hypothetical protein